MCKNVKSSKTAVLSSISRFERGRIIGLHEAEIRFREISRLVERNMQYTGTLCRRMEYDRIFRRISILHEDSGPSEEKNQASKGALWNFLRTRNSPLGCNQPR